MHINDIERSEDLISTIIQQLKKLGVKHRTKKINKKLQVNHLSGQHVFKKSLQFLPLQTVELNSGAKFQVPQLVHELCSYITAGLETEGLFRKAGSTARQKEIKLLLDAGCELSSEHHVIDVANVLKLFFRELPEPLIPYAYHDTFLQCLLAKKGEIINALLLACLLLPPLHLSTLYYFMEFLRRVVKQSKINKMDIKNIAIVMTPTVMPIEDKVIAYSTQRLNHHVHVLQLLLENAEQLGEIPSCVTNSLHLPKNQTDSEEIKRKKKRRSGSLTRMLHGLRKMVSSKSEDCTKQISIATPDLLLTPNVTTQSAKKRKNLQQSGFSNKRRREIMDTLPQASALANTPFKFCQTPVVCHHPHPESNTPAITPATITTTPAITTTTTQPELKIIPLDLSSKSSPANKQIQPEFVRIPKSEYEEIKSRVSAIEDRISHELHCVQVSQTSSHVQTVYEKTLEEVGALSPTTDQLAKRFSRELKIRRSADHKIIRSPSARKIGTIRRRSQENAKQLSRNQSCSLPRTTLKRGRPNTVLSGLPQPSPGKGAVGRASSFHNHTHTHASLSVEKRADSLEKWASAEMYFKGDVDAIKVAEQNRDSLARLRSQNAGMVLAKAKLFNELSSEESGSATAPEHHDAVQLLKRAGLRRGGTFPRQNPTLRRLRNHVNHVNHVNHTNHTNHANYTNHDQSEKENHQRERLMNGVRRSPRRAKPVKVVRQ